jgi:hypothetical protein
MFSSCLRVLSSLSIHHPSPCETSRPQTFCRHGGASSEATVQSAQKSTDPDIQLSHGNVRVALRHEDV